MKSLLRHTLIYALVLYILPDILPGISIAGGTSSYLIAGFLLTLLFKIIKPILNILSFPINLLTLGLFSIVTNALILYLLTVIYAPITIVPYTFPGVDIAGFVIPQFFVNQFFAFITAAMVISAVTSLIEWLFD